MKLCILVPTRGMVATGFAHDLAQLVACTNATGAELSIAFSPGTLIADQRVNLAKEALRRHADWALWLDDDMRFPPDAVIQLLTHRRSIVAANYVRRVVPCRPVAYMHDDKTDVWSTVSSVGKSGLEQVDAVGMGVMLTSMDVFKKIEEPFFHIGYSKKNSTFYGEDLFFAHQCAKQGIAINIDHNLSQAVKHIGTMEYGIEHTDIGVDNG